MPEFLPFLGVAVVLVITPGPDMALITRNALLHGRRAALLTALGVNAGLMGWTIAAALGIATVVRSSAVAFETLRFLGALYLVFLGVQAIISSISRPGTAPLTSAPSRQPLTVGVDLVKPSLSPRAVAQTASMMPERISTIHAMWRSP